MSYLITNSFRVSQPSSLPGLGLSCNHCVGQGAAHGLYPYVNQGWSIGGYGALNGGRYFLRGCRFDIGDSERAININIPIDNVYTK